MSIKVSVILPSLNVADYIEETIRSAAAQCLKDIEIVCVDAGSDDGTLDIINHYAGLSHEPGSELPPITLIESDIKSYGHQVNLGIDAASGEYIGILETDDVAAPEMYDELYKLAVKNGADIAKSTYFDYYGQGKGFITLGDRHVLTGSARRSLLSAVSAPSKVFKAADCPELLLHHPSVWSAIYKRSWLSEKGIRFPEIPGAGWADNPFFIETFAKADRISYTPRAFYYYRKDNPASSTALKNCRMPFERIAEMRKLTDDTVILKTIDHRALRYAADALASPSYDEEKDADFIRETLVSITESYVCTDAHVTAAEKAAYAHFTGRDVPDTLDQKVAALGYKLRYGIKYIINRIFV